MTQIVPSVSKSLSHNSSSVGTGGKEMMGALVPVDGSSQVANIVDCSITIPLWILMLHRRKWEQKETKRGYGVAVDSTIGHHELPRVDVLEDIITSGING